MSVVESYDSSTNLLDHLEGYKALMMLQGAMGALLYLAFSTILKKTVWAWYFRLLSESISSFEQLERQFIAHFGHSQV